jgi:hypothetical protein
LLGSTAEVRPFEIPTNQYILSGGSLALYFSTRGMISIYLRETSTIHRPQASSGFFGAYTSLNSRWRMWVGMATRQLIPVKATDDQILD